MSSMKRSKKFGLIIFLFIILGFCVGLVIGYLFVGYDIEKSCVEAIEERDLFIEERCGGDFGLSSEGWALPEEVWGVNK